MILHRRRMTIKSSSILSPEDNTLAALQIMAQQVPSAEGGTSPDISDVVSVRQVGVWYDIRTPLLPEFGSGAGGGA